MMFVFSFFFFFEQKTAYEMRISDWSSDVCSSDLKQLASRGLLFRAEAKPIEAVIPNLTNLVEQTCLALFFRGFDRLRQARALEACLRNQFIGLRHIGVMVLALVVTESLLGDDITERVFRIGEFGQYESHGIATVYHSVEQLAGERHET